MLVLLVFYCYLIRDYPGRYLKIIQKTVRAASEKTFEILKRQINYIASLRGIVIV